jgi:DNA-binding GntR family transcriptional regulator
MNVFEPQSRPLKRKSLHQELADQLRDLIVSGELEQGKKVPEKDLCSHFGVSRTPLREALKVLANDQLISLKPNRGAWVTPITRANVGEIYPVMGALEGLAGEMACARLSNAGIARIKGLHQKLEKTYGAQDRAGFFEVNQNIHEEIMIGAENQTLSAQFQSLAIRIRQARYLAPVSAEQWALTFSEHEEMIACLEARDGPGLARVLRTHLEHKAATVIAWLDQKPGSV